METFYIYVNSSIIDQKFLFNTLSAKCLTAKGILAKSLCTKVKQTLFLYSYCLAGQYICWPFKLNDGCNKKINSFQIKTIKVKLGLFVCLSVCLFVRPSVLPNVHPSVRPSVCLSICLFVSPTTCLSVCPSLHLFVLLPKDLLTILIHTFILNSKIACKCNRNPKYKPKPILLNFYVQVIIPFHCKNVFSILYLKLVSRLNLKKLKILSIVNDCRLATERREWTDT